jgi:hypothetical protein
MTGTSRSRAIQTVLLAGLTAGVLDITAAIVFYARLGAQTVPMLQGIASGLLGKAAFSGGLATAALGLLCHFFIATSAAGLYYMLSRRVPFLIQHTVVSGALYGVAVYFFMSLVVVPLSAIGPRPFVLGDALVGIAIHVCCVGLPIALVVRRFAR